jgi:cyclopropane-fatty-acyl-phospholipid synthase
MGSTQSDVEVSYDVSNEFFRLWLDERMNYTCALFEGTDNLEEAQLKKLAWLSDAAHVTEDKTVLDIGCGWGANLEYLATTRGVRAAHGITLSRQQKAEIDRRQLPGVTAQVCSYLDYQPPVKFDSIISPTRRAPASRSRCTGATSSSRTAGRTRGRTSACRRSFATACHATPRICAISGG